MTGRRITHRVQELGVEELVTELLSRPGMTYERIAELVSEQTGETIGKSSIARYNQSVQRRLRRITELRESANALAGMMANSGEEPDMAMADMLVSMMQLQLTNALSDEDVSNKDLVGLSIAGSQVVKAHTAIEKIRLTERQRMRRAFTQVAAELQELLRASDLWPRIESVISGYQRQLEENT